MQVTANERGENERKGRQGREGAGAGFYRAKRVCVVAHTTRKSLLFRNQGGNPKGEEKILRKKGTKFGGKQARTASEDMGGFSCYATAPRGCWRDKKGKKMVGAGAGGKRS